MATNIARAQAILEAILNGPSTVAQRTRIAAAYGASGQSLDQQAGVFVQAMRTAMLNRVRDYEQQAAIDAAAASAFQKATTDFPEAP